MRYDDPSRIPGPRRSALIDALGGGAVTRGAAAAPINTTEPVGTPIPAGGGDYIPAQSIYDTSGMSDAQRSAFQRDTQDRLSRDQSAFNADTRAIGAMGGNIPSGWRGQFNPTAMPNAGDYGGTLVGGSDFTGAGASTPEQASSAPGQRYRIQPVDQAKFDDPTHRTGKYDFLRIAQKYDPTQGITPAMLDELNKLGYGTFSSTGGDKLSLTGVTDAGRAAGIDPHNFSGDFIQGFKGGTPQWAWDWYDPNSGGGAAPSGGGGMFAGSTIPTMLQGDASSGIQQALQNIGALSQGNRLQQLIAALGGGQ